VKKEVLDRMMMHGLALVELLLIQQIEQLHIDKLTEEGELESLKKKIANEHKRIVKRLGSPWFAIDECHTAFKIAPGLLFHSDYKREDDLGWQKYELLKSLGCSEKEADVSQHPKESDIKEYPYKTCTSLFSTFRWLAEEFLKDSDVPQLTIFTSTHFRVWKSLLEKYSRDKPLIERYYQLPELTEDDILEDVLRHQPTLSEWKEDLKKLTRFWKGRPGYYCEHLRRRLTGDIQLSSFREFEEIHSAASTSAFDQLNSFFHEMPKTIATPNTTFSRESTQLKALLSYAALMKAGSLTGLSRDVSEIVTAGIGRVKQFVFQEKKSVALIDEPIVLEYLTTKRLTSPRLIESVILEELRSNQGDLGETAIALQLLIAEGQTLVQLLESWCPSVRQQLNPQLIEWMRFARLKASTSASTRDLKIETPKDLFNNIWGFFPGKIVIPMKNLVLPDLLLACPYATDAGFFVVSIQVKTHANRLGTDDFNR